MKRIINQFVFIVLIFTITQSLVGCASMDLRLDTIPASDEYGKRAPRVSADICSYYSKNNEPDPSTYFVLAQYIVQENPSVLTSWAARDMICQVYKEAVGKGADAIIVDKIGTTSVAGGAQRTSPVIDIRSIRFKGDLPTK